jgi:hypothetical protein
VADHFDWAGIAQTNVNGLLGFGPDQSSPLVGGGESDPGPSSDTSP